MKWKLLLMTLLFVSCNKTVPDRPVILSNGNWIVIKLTDSTLLCSPGVDGNKNVKPFILKTNETDTSKF